MNETLQKVDQIRYNEWKPCSGSKGKHFPGHTGKYCTETWGGVRSSPRWMPETEAVKIGATISNSHTICPECAESR